MPDALKLDTVVIIAFGLAVLSILLGFAALLTQRIYLDASTQKPIEVGVPFLGKMKTNYPALVFVFLGFGLAFYVLERTLPAKEKKDVQWQITGSFVDSGVNDWKTGGQLTVFPPGIKTDVTPNGFFTISMNIEEGKSFEDVIETIQYWHRDGQIEIDPRGEYSAFNSGKACNLDKVLPHARKYKPIPLQRLDARVQPR